MSALSLMRVSWKPFGLSLSFQTLSTGKGTEQRNNEFEVLFEGNRIRDELGREVDFFGFASQTEQFSLGNL